MATSTYETPRLEFKLRIVQNPNMPSISKISDRPYTWREVQEIIRTNQLEHFARSQYQTERYHDFKLQLKHNNTTIFKHMVIKELQWFDNNDIEDHKIEIKSASDKLFTCKEDLKILPNHFPYYFEKDVKHFCVWSKLKIPSDENSELGDLSPSMRQLIEAYIDKTFVQGLGINRDNLVWFRNWEALQSVKAISHVHVIVKGITPEQEQKILYGPGIPLTEEELDTLLSRN